NKRHVEVREVMNGIMYILSTGCQWRAIPKDLPPRSTLFDYLDLWSYDGTLDRIHHVLYVGGKANEKPSRPPPSSIAKAGRALKKAGCIDPDGYDAGKKVKGKKRHILVERWVCCCTPSFILPMSKIAMAASCFLRPFSGCTLS